MASLTDLIKQGQQKTTKPAFTAAKEAGTAPAEPHNYGDRMTDLLRLGGDAIKNATQPSGGGYPYGGWGGGYGYGGGGGGGGSGSTDPTDLQKAVAKNLEPITKYNYDTLGNKFKLGDKVYDTADQQTANLEKWLLQNSMRNLGNEWYRQRQKTQSMFQGLKDKIQQGGYSSGGSAGLYDIVSRIDDQMDDDTLQAIRSNAESIMGDAYQAYMDNVNSRNKLAADTETSMRELLSDYGSQLNNIHPQLANGEYQSGVTGFGDNRKEGSAPDDADELPAGVIKDGKVVAPDWLKTNFANKNWTNPYKPAGYEYLRPNSPGETTTNSGLRTYGPSKSSSANNRTGYASYFGGYNSYRANRGKQ